MTKGLGWEHWLSRYGNLLHKAKVDTLSRLSYILTSQTPGNGCTIPISKKWMLGLIIVVHERLK